MLTTVFRIAVERLDPTIIEKLVSGTVKFTQSGVLYEGNKILAHLPLEKVSPADLSKLTQVTRSMSPRDMVSSVRLQELHGAVGSLNNLATANLALTACSTVLILGAIVAATKFLSDKIDAVHARLAEVQEDLRGVSDFQHIYAFSRYIGTLRAASIYTDRNLLLENKQDASRLASELALERSKLCELYGMLFENTKNSNSTAVQRGNMRFIIMLLDMLPHGYRMEHAMLCDLENFSIADKRAEQVVAFYDSTRNKLREFWGGEYRKILQGASSPFIDMLHTEQQHIIEITTKKEGHCLLATTLGIPQTVEALKMLEA